MKLVRDSDLQWEKYEDWHNMSAGFHDDLTNNSSADVMFAQIAPGAELGIHYHHRPASADGSSDGWESFFFYCGGNIILTGHAGDTPIDSVEPFTVTFGSGESEAHGIRNVGDVPVRFQVICAPRFVDDEEVRL